MKNSCIIMLLLAVHCFAQEVLRPTTDIDPGAISLGSCTNISHQASSPMKLSYDAAGLTTFSTLSVGGDDTTSHSQTRSFANWQNTGNSYTALTLNINASIQPDAPANGCIKYSTDGGLTYATVSCSSTFIARQTFAITLTPAQDLNKLRVSSCVFAAKGNSHAEIDPGFVSVFIWDLWTSGTNPVPATGNGSGAGQPHRSAAVTN